MQLNNYGPESALKHVETLPTTLNLADWAYPGAGFGVGMSMPDGIGGWGLSGVVDDIWRVESEAVPSPSSNLTWIGLAVMGFVYQLRRRRSFISVG